MNSIFLNSISSSVELGIILVMGIVPIIVIVDIMNNGFRGTYTKWVWCAVVIFIPIVGPLTYVLLGREQRVVN